MGEEAEQELLDAYSNEEFPKKGDECIICNVETDYICENCENPYCYDCLNEDLMCSDCDSNEEMYNI